MKCGVCGANYTKHGRNRFACAGARNRATCTNHLTIRGDDLEAAILAGLKEHLMDPSLFEELVGEFIAELNRQQSDLADEKVSLQKELDWVTRQIDKLVEAILGGANARAINTKLLELEAKKVVLMDNLRATPAVEPLLHPALAKIYREKVKRLEHALRAPNRDHEAFEIIRRLIDSVQLMPVNGELQIELRGELASILALTDSARASGFSPENKALQIKMVAGARCHLYRTTFRLGGRRRTRPSFGPSRRG